MTSASFVVAVSPAAALPLMRLFASDWRAVEASPDWDVLRDLDRDETDEARALVLTTIASAPIVTASVHPGVDPRDVLHVYLERPPTLEKVFACVVVSEDRLREMLQEAETVLEGLSLQVAPSPHLTHDVIRAAVQTWAARNFGFLPLVSLHPWRDANDDDALEASGIRQLDFSLRADFEPAHDVAEPPWEDAA